MTDCAGSEMDRQTDPGSGERIVRGWQITQGDFLEWLRNYGPDGTHLGSVEDFKRG